MSSVLIAAAKPISSATTLKMLNSFSLSPWLSLLGRVMFLGMTTSSGESAALMRRRRQHLFPHPHHKWADLLFKALSGLTFFSPISCSRAGTRVSLPEKENIREIKPHRERKNLPSGGLYVEKFNCSANKKTACVSAIPVGLIICVHILCLITCTIIPPVRLIDNNIFTTATEAPVSRGFRRKNGMQSNCR